jgi:hypothetical protein
VDQIMALLRISRTPVYFADHFRPYSEPRTIGRNFTYHEQVCKVRTLTLQMVEPYVNLALRIQ